MNSETIVTTVLGFYPDVEAIYIFGTYGTSDEQKGSDADIALLFPHDRAKLIKNLVVSECRYALEEILKRDVDIINLRMVNTVFQHEIVQEGRIIYQQDENAVDHFEMSVISSYQKLNEERAGIIQEIFESGRILNI
ncbi:MAG: nucleotidyltransferase domain-containing protein [Deltaproteobacteria bacterium]|nr:nucleotidyltransferase domain-containing protein [Deltaproteobacteria bacterium]